MKTLYWFTNVRCTITSDIKIDKQVDNRLKTTSSAFDRLYKWVRYNKNLKKGTNTSVYWVIVLAILRQDSESWSHLYDITIPQTNIYVWVCLFNNIFMIIQRVKARATPCSHQQLLLQDRVFKRITPDQLKAEITLYVQIFIIQRVKARVIPCPHQPPTSGDDTISVAQSVSANPGATKQLLPPIRVFKRILYIYVRSIKSRDYIVHSSSF